MLLQVPLLKQNTRGIVCIQYHVFGIPYTLYLHNAFYSIFLPSHSAFGELPTWRFQNEFLRCFAIRDDYYFWFIVINNICSIYYNMVHTTHYIITLPNMLLRRLQLFHDEHPVLLGLLKIIDMWTRNTYLTCPFDVYSFVLSYT